MSARLASLLVSVQEDWPARASEGCSDGGGTAEGATGEDPELSAIPRDRAGPPQEGARADQAADKRTARAVWKNSGQQQHPDDGLVNK